MTANEILNQYLVSLQASDSGGRLKIENVVLDILKYLDYREKGKDRGDESYPMIPRYQNDKLWVEIEKKSFQFFIELPKLRQILEKYKILSDEKDRM